MNENMFRVKIKRRAVKILERLPRDYRIRILEILDELKVNPLPYKRYDLKKLKGVEDAFRIRMGDVRIVYTIDWNNDIVIVHFIGFRRYAYK